MKDLVVRNIDRATLALSKANTLQQVKEIIALAEAARVFGKRVDASIETINYASAVRLRAERKLGEMLEKTPRNTGAKGVGKSVLPKGKDTPPTLDSVKISYKTSSRAQILAAAPEPEFEAAIVIKPDDRTKAGLTEDLNHNRVVNDFKENAQRKARRDKRIKAAEGFNIDERIIVGDFRQHAHRIPNESIPLIYTDPPYNKVAEKLFDDLGRFSFDKLTEGGSLLCYCGHLQLPIALAALSKHLRFFWCNAIVHGGEMGLMREYGIRVGWKPLLWFVKTVRDDKLNIIWDTITGSREKSHHDWQQSEAEARYYINELCPQDGIVCDPFFGGGTTGYVANELKRQWIAFEIDPETARIASARLA